MDTTTGTTNGIATKSTTTPPQQYGSLLLGIHTNNNSNPSNHSTNHPTLQKNTSTTTTNGNNNHTNNDNDETNRLLGTNTTNASSIRKAMSFEDAMYQHVTGRHVRTRTVIIAIAVVACITIGSVAVVWSNNNNTSSTTVHKWKDSELIPYGPSTSSAVNTNTDTNSAKHSATSTTKNQQRARAVPFSILHPVTDLGLYNYSRPTTSVPGNPMMNDQRIHRTNYPTNAWYQSLLQPNEEPTEDHRAYAIPYIVDTVGPIPGLRLHPNHIDASSFVIQLYVINEYGLTVGAAAESKSKSGGSTTATTKHNSDGNQDRTDAASPTTATLTTAKQPKDDTNNSSSTSLPTHQYKVTHATPLGVTLDWDYYPMSSSITKGMPYGTMIYETIRQPQPQNKDWTTSTPVVPTIVAEMVLAANPIVDGGTTTTTTGNSSSSSHAIQCSSREEPFVVQREVELFFKQSDFTWIVFVSEPVLMRCRLDENNHLKLQIVDWNDRPDEIRPLVVRVALSKKCTSGINPIYCHQELLHPTALLLGQGNYAKQLRKHVNYFPGPNTRFDYDFENATVSKMMFDWDVQNMSDYALSPLPDDTNATDLSLIAFALPHHFDIIAQVPPSDHDIYCVSTLTGPACLYEGPIWELYEPIPPIGFRAPRPPAPWAISSIAQSLHHDINFTLPAFYERGAGDTYFSGKMLAKLGRILLVAEEMNELCNTTTSNDTNDDDTYTDACQNVTLPSAVKFSDAVNRLRRSVEVWINGTAEIPFVYDSAWGGVVSCGCDFDPDKGKCRNKFPHCSAFGDPGLNFGNAFYNDVHFHYGYFIFAAAVVAHFDPEWGRNTFENVLLLIRCIANPSEDDDAFPIWRHKDWYQGHSWASGIAKVFLNGKNQESSSEAIAAYEAIALYGSSMQDAWEDVGSRSNAKIALAVKQAGQLLTATELRSARTYWHVTEKAKIKIYPSAYTPRTIGILWQTMAQCQTWFGAAPYLAYGIQLLPITPISEYRDTVPWAKETYHIFAGSCGSNPGCTDDGWSIIQLALLATVGHQEKSAEIANTLSPDVFDSAGGNGHSLSNTLWYFATRPLVDEPLSLTKAEKASGANNSTANKTVVKVNEVSDCGRPGICTDYVLDTIAGEYSCRQRMDWLIQEMSKTESEACIQIARVENPYECGACDPDRHDNVTSHYHSKCAHCTQEQCNSDLNRCPLYEATFVCTAGDSTGGCSSSPWDVPNTQCRECCELTHCEMPSAAEIRANNEADCPPCTKADCRRNACEKSVDVQYVCLEGPSSGGCSPLPWEIHTAQCLKCCSFSSSCRK